MSNITITPEDREAAANLIAWHNAAASQWSIEGGNDLRFFAADMPDAIRRGVWDNHDVVQAFVRHAESARLSGHQQGVAEERERAAGIAAEWKSSLRPGSSDRLNGHIEAARSIAEAIRTPNKGEATPQVQP